MPLLTLRTNQPLDAAATDRLMRDLSRAAAESLGKPESYVMVRLDAGQPLLFGGSDAPAAFLQLKSLGLTEDRTKDLSRLLCDLVGDHVGVPAARTYIEFASPARAFWGWNGGTFG